MERGCREQPVTGGRREGFFVCCSGVSSAAAGCGCCSEPSLTRIRAAVHTLLASGCSLTPGAQLLSALPRRDGGWSLEDPQEKQKPTLFSALNGSCCFIFPCCNSHCAKLEVCWILCSTGAAKKIKLKIELYISLPVRKFLGKPEGSQSSRRHWDFGLHVEIK